MSEKKGWGKSVLGWFVVQEGEEDNMTPPTVAEGELSADDLIAKYAAEDQPDPPPPPPPVVELSGPLPQAVDGVIDFEAVYESAGIEQAERDRVKKALELLGALPAETPEAVKKQIVEASLKAFGVPTDQIIEAAVAELEALESFIRTGQGQTQNLLAEASHRITSLEQEIQHLRQSMDSAMAEQRTRTFSANRQKLEVQKVLEFFGQDAVAKVVQQSPKLHEPPADG